MKSQRRILILGASTRSAAHSAVRAEFDPICADLFADADLKEVCDAEQIEDYPQGLLAFAKQVPPSRWFYTGALENDPQTIAAVSMRHTLLGNPANVVKPVRDPFCLQETLTAAGLSTPDVRSSSAPPEPDGNWLLKPQQSGGGRGIRVWNEKTLDSSTRKERHFFQRRCMGISLSAVFLAARSGSHLMGISQQFVGEQSLNAAEFSFCGAVGPIACCNAIQQQIVAVGKLLAAQFGLRGLFGCDFVINHEERVDLIEVNPRYTASVEIYEHAFGIPLLKWHVLACETFCQLPQSGHAASELAEALDQFESASPQQVVAKAILYAPQNLIVPSLIEFRNQKTVEMVPFVADIPRPGTPIHSAHPICTVLAVSQDCCRALQLLDERAKRVWHLLLGACVEMNLAQRFTPVPFKH